MTPSQQEILDLKKALAKCQARVAELEGLLADKDRMSGQGPVSPTQARIAELEGVLREIEEKSESISWEGEIARAALRSETP